MTKRAKDASYTHQRRFGMRLRMCRIDRGWDTVGSFASTIGMETEAYRLYEVGLRSPPIHNLVAISEALNVSLDYLILGRNGTPPRVPTQHE